MKKKIMKNRASNNRPRRRHGHKYIHVRTKSSATFEDQFIKKLSNTEAELRKYAVDEKSVCLALLP